MQVNDVIGLAGRGADAHIVFDFGDDMGASTCVGCGECVQACPTGALMPKTLLDYEQKLAITPDRHVNSVCPYCGVGCQLTFSVKDEAIVAVSGREGSGNESADLLFRTRSLGNQHVLLGGPWSGHESADPLFRTPLL